MACSLIACSLIAWPSGSAPVMPVVRASASAAPVDPVGRSPGWPVWRSPAPRDGAALAFIFRRLGERSRELVRAWGYDTSVDAFVAATSA
jgi:hypothetical protein